MNKPTDNCSKDITYRIALIVTGIVVGLLGAAIVVAVASHCMCKQYQKAKNFRKMTPEERMHIQDKIERDEKRLDKVRCDQSIDPQINEKRVNDIKEGLDYDRNRIRPDGPDGGDGADGSDEGDAPTNKETK